MKMGNLTVAISLFVVFALVICPGFSMAQGPASLYLAHGCGAKPCQTFIPVASENPTLESRNIMHPEYVNDAMITIRSSNGNATVSVKWHTMTADGVPSDGDETYDLQDVATLNPSLIRLPTGTWGENDFYLVVADSLQMETSEFLDLPQFDF